MNGPRASFASQEAVDHDAMVERRQPHMPQKCVGRDGPSPRAMRSVLEREAACSEALSEKLGAGAFSSPSPRSRTELRAPASASSEPTILSLEEMENFLPAMRHWQRKYRSVISEKI